MKPWTLRAGDDTDIAAALAQARSGMSVETWHEAAHRELPQAKKAERDRVIRRAEELVDIDVLRDLGRREPRHELLAPSSFLDRFNARDAGARERNHILVARRFATHPWVRAVAKDLLGPILTQSELPLPARSSVVDPQELDAFIDAHLDGGCSASARANTRLALLRALKAMGTLVKKKGALRAARPYPDHAAVAWLLGWQLAEEKRMTMMNREACTESIAAQAWLLTPSYVEICIESGVSAGLLHQGYIVGAGRISLPG